jgi:hypothetical protein
MSQSIRLQYSNKPRPAFVPNSTHFTWNFTLEIKTHIDLQLGDGENCLNVTNLSPNGSAKNHKYCGQESNLPIGCPYKTTNVNSQRPSPVRARYLQITGLPTKQSSGCNLLARGLRVSETPDTCCIVISLALPKKALVKPTQKYK